MLLLPDVYNQQPDILRSIKYVTFDKKQNIRLDRIDLKFENGSRILERMTHFGKMIGNLFAIDDFSYSKMDIEKTVPVVEIMDK